MMHLEQRQRATTLLRERGIARAIFASPFSTTWLTGFAPSVQVGPSPALGGPVLVGYAEGEFTLFVHEWSKEEAAASGCPVVTYPAQSAEAPITAPQDLQKLVRAWQGKVGRVGVEAHYLPAALLPEASTSIDGWLDELRVIKTDDEVAKLRQAFALTDVGHAAARRAIQPGVREIDVWTAIHSAIQQHAGQRIPLGNDCVVGYRPNNIGGWPGDLPLRAGDTVIVDLSTRVQGYWSDSCGTYAVSELNTRQSAATEVVQQALALAVSLARPGILASALDAQVRQFIAQAGYPVYPHHTGHGVGTSFHEEVRITPYNHRPLQAGMVLMFEPGIYFSGEFGVRYEDAVLVTAGEAEVLTRHNGK